MRTIQLFCGRNIPTGGVVTEEQIGDFLRFVVTPRFDGFTITEALGYWKGEPEDTMVLTICCEEYDLPKVQEIAQLYKQTFKQDSVAMLELPAMAFV